MAPDRDVREALRRQVFIRAYSSARADGVASQRQVDVLLNKVLVQVRNFLCRDQEPVDVDNVIDWWSELEDLEGLLAMTWLERHGICPPRYILKGKKVLESLRKNYPGIPAWMVKRRDT